MNVLSNLLADKDKCLIMLLLILLIRENDDKVLILALIYILFA